MLKSKYTVLLVDDSEDDRLFMRRALSQSSKPFLTQEVSDGEEAINYLSGQAPFTDRQKHPFPDILLLDLKMPRKTGYDVLQWLQRQAFRKPRIIVLSGSFLPEDIKKSFSLGANAYHIKSALKAERDAIVSKVEESLENY